MLIDWCNDKIFIEQLKESQGYLSPPGSGHSLTKYCRSSLQDASKSPDEFEKTGSIHAPNDVSASQFCKRNNFFCCVLSLWLSSKVFATVIRIEFHTNKPRCDHIALKWGPPTENSEMNFSMIYFTFSAASMHKLCKTNIKTWGEIRETYSGKIEVSDLISSSFKQSIVSIWNLNFCTKSTYFVWIGVFATMGWYTAIKPFPTSCTMIEPESR